MVTPFHLNTSIANALVVLQKPSPMLRRKNRIRAIQASLAIEGNSLTFEQVTDLFDKKRVIGPQQDILEVQKAIETYQQIGKLIPFSLTSFLDTHRGLMQGLVAAPGQLRKGPTGAIRPSYIFHEAPDWRNVRPMMQELFAYLKKSDDHLVVKSCRKSLSQLLADTRSVTLNASDRLAFARSVFKIKIFSGKDYQIHLKSISNATASRDLQRGVKIGLLQKTGHKRTTKYVFDKIN